MFKGYAIHAKISTTLLRKTVAMKECPEEYHLQYYSSSSGTRVHGETLWNMWRDIVFWHVLPVSITCLQAARWLKITHLYQAVTPRGCKEETNHATKEYSSELQAATICLLALHDFCSAGKSLIQFKLLALVLHCLQSFKMYTSVRLLWTALHEGFLLDLVLELLGFFFG